jgi:hypothetical protein
MIETRHINGADKQKKDKLMSVVDGQGEVFE